MEVCRFAPSTTGPAHPGTLLAGLLCWLDARSKGSRLLLRLEDLDPERSREVLATRMQGDLAWLGLDWDEVALQSSGGERHAAALDRLAGCGRLYPCDCSRTEIRAHGLRAPDGGHRYPNTCRGAVLPPGGWRACASPVRVRLPEGRIDCRDESGLDLSQDPVAEMGDPIVVRRDGSVAYHLASVVDDAAHGVTRVVRGRDLAASSGTQIAMQQLLGFPTPVYRHHLLLQEEQGGKLAKLHGAVGIDELREAYDGPTLCGVLACCVGLAEDPRPTSPVHLLGDFSWERVRSRDRAATWTGKALEFA